MLWFGLLAIKPLVRSGPNNRSFGTYVPLIVYDPMGPHVIHY
jgi:hypothetical protein